MKILITGGSGLLGKSLLETAPKECTLSLTYNKNRPMTTGGPVWYHLDIRSRADVFEMFEIARPNVVIHTASIGGVDYSEDHYDQTREVNVGGLSHIIDACKGYKSKLIYISSNAVYSGKQPPYNEDSQLEPVNAYGVIKRLAERRITDTASDWLIIRPFMLYGWPYSGGRTNWAKAIVYNSRNNITTKLVNDVVWMPTYAPDCAGVIWHLAAKEIDKEILNVASPERATLYEFGLHISDVFGLDKGLLEPVKTDHFKSIAKRPKDTTYDLVRLAERGFMLSDIKTGLEKMKAAEAERLRCHQ